jgi:hypothetical protein
MIDSAGGGPAQPPVKVVNANTDIKQTLQISANNFFFSTDKTSSVWIFVDSDYALLHISAPLQFSFSKILIDSISPPPHCQAVVGCILEFVENF